jgi:hypothetical protein
MQQMRLGGSQLINTVFMRPFYFGASSCTDFSEGQCIGEDTVCPESIQLPQEEFHLRNLDGRVQLDGCTRIDSATGTP